MNAILLAAGLGTRLRPLTNTTPKCLVPVGGRPLLEWWLIQLRAIDVKKVIINTHYFAEQVEEYVVSSEFKDFVTLVYEPELLGTLGSLRHLLEHVGSEPCIVAHADNFCVTDWQAFIRKFEQRPDGCELTAMVFKTATPESCGMLSFDANDVVTSFIEKPQVKVSQPWANAATTILGKTAIEDVLNFDAKADDFCKDFLPTHVNKMNVYINDDILIDVGTYESYSLANRVVKNCNHYSEVLIQL